MLTAIGRRRAWIRQTKSRLWAGDKHRSYHTVSITINFSYITYVSTGNTASRKRNLVFACSLIGGGRKNRGGYWQTWRSLFELPCDCLLAAINYRSHFNRSKLLNILLCDFNLFAIELYICFHVIELSLLLVSVTWKHNIFIFKLVYWLLYGVLLV